ncbi:MAG TPA: NADPH-dependent 7-cyano-7-deazaguanine reductase QueF [Pseudomonadales bacterium]|nr:NADPH-dependent 7-cyano-7-deazaguanine reductase QueF [Pseudomonadales bacterium]
MTIDYSQLPLGKHTAYSDQYDPSLLVAVPRLQTRDFWQPDKALPFRGTDSWTAYEVSWLNNKGKPQVACLILGYDAMTPNIVESKSLKLYLNSFNQTRFDSTNEIIDRITTDVEKTTAGTISVKWHNAALDETLAIKNWADQCIDDLDISIEQYHVDATLLQCNMNAAGEQTLVSHLLRSNCPVTGQPDWASVRIAYQGHKISEESLLRYICSYRQHQGFHEQCIERIFCDIWTHCKPERLSVEGRFTRRGGLDINPFRASHTDMHPTHARQVRQ